MAQDHEEKRTYNRLEVATEIEYRLASGDASQSGTLEDVSATGARFRGPSQLPVDSRLQVTIRGGEGEEPLRAVAVVLRCEPVGEEFTIACRLEEVR